MTPPLVEFVVTIPDTPGNSIRIAALPTVQRKLADALWATGLEGVTVRQVEPEKEGRDG